MVKKTALSCLGLVIMSSLLNIDLDSGKEENEKKDSEEESEKKDETLEF
jgi:hypothetical protein